MTAPAPAAGSPVHLTRFIGRRAEISSLRRLLNTTRLLTLTGAGGCGKTRLAAALIEESTDLAGEFSWVDLAPISDPALIPHQIVAALGAKEGAWGSPIEALWHCLEDRSLLLVLDNCEHLVEACATLVEAMLLRVDGLKILTTSREALGIGGETAWLVPPMSLPDDAPGGVPTAERVRESEAVQLFVERAQAVFPAFQLTDENAPGVARVCRRLDGIPLAIELAAARVRALSPEQLASRLSDAFRVLASPNRSSLARHRTLRETIDWSYQLLSAREQRLLECLSVFAGRFTLDAAEYVAAGSDMATEDILDALCGLVDKSLVVMHLTGSEARYRLLETVSQYAAEKLAARADQAETRERHAHYYLMLAEQAAPRIFGGAGDSDWLARVGEENDNLRHALDWCAQDAERTDVALRLVYALHWFWFAQGQLLEGRRRLEQALGNRLHATPLLRGRALVAFNQVLFWQGEHPSPQIGTEAVQLLRPAGDPESLSYGLSALAVSHYIDGAASAAVALLDEAWSLLREERPSVLTAVILYWRGRAAQAAGNLAVARTSAEGAIAIGRRMNNGPAIAHPLTAMASIAKEEGQYEEALSCLAEALDIHSRNEDRWGVTQVMHRLCEVAATRDAVIAARLVGITDAVRAAIDSVPSPQEASELERVRAQVRHVIGQERLDQEMREGQATTFADGVEYAAANIPRLAVTALPQVTGEYPVAVGPDTPPESPTLSVIALGGLQIVVNGRRLDAEAWGSARARELLVFLLCHPNGCTKEQVGLAFWPDGSTAQVRNNFHVTLHRLRKALGGSERIALKGDRYGLDPSVHVQFDATEFEDGYQKALHACRRQASDAVDQLARVVASYQGPLLANENIGDWCEPFRARLHRLYTDAATRLADLMALQQRPGEAAEVLETLIARDPLHEDSYRRLMMCYSRQGRHGDALQLYQRLAGLLESEFGAAPSRETSQLFESLRTPAA